MAVTWSKLAYEDDVITKAILDAVGDMIYASGNDTPAILTIGANNKVLTVVGGLPAWSDSGAGISLAEVLTWSTL